MNAISGYVAPFPRAKAPPAKTTGDTGGENDKFQNGGRG